jgi:hypothetical protein
MAQLPFSRTPWPLDFPLVTVLSDEQQRNSNPAFAMAKAGDREAAIDLVTDLLAESRTFWSEFGPNSHKYRPDTLLIPVTALEVSGFNAIPDALCRALAANVGLPMWAGEVTQSNKVMHTRASGWQRFVTPATFAGNIVSDRTYIIVDDHIGHGGTLANLRGFIEASGGQAIDMVTLSASREAERIALRPETLFVLRERHGSALEHFWRSLFGYGLDCLTEVEAGYLARQPSFDAIRDRMAEAAEQARGRGLGAAVVELGE